MGFRGPAGVVPGRLVVLDVEGTRTPVPGSGGFAVTLFDAAVDDADADGAAEAASATPVGVPLPAAVAAGDDFVSAGRGDAGAISEATGDSVCVCSFGRMTKKATAPRTATAARAATIFSAGLFAGAVTTFASRPTGVPAVSVETATTRDAASSGAATVSLSGFTSRRGVAFVWIDGADERESAGGGIVLLNVTGGASMTPAPISACVARSAQIRARRGAKGISAHASSAMF